jgi:hypothetical protein
MGTAIALLLTIMLIPVIVKLIGDAQVWVHERHHQESHRP